MSEDEKIFTLIFSDNQKRIINLNTFIGSDMILILLGFKQYNEMKQDKNKFLKKWNRDVTHAPS